MKMNNRWNRIIYCLWAPIYDSTVEHFFARGRKHAMQILDLRPGGRAVIFDKFLPDDGRLSLGRRRLNLGATIFGTDITRRFSDLAVGCQITVLSNEPSLLRGAYRVIRIANKIPKNSFFRQIACCRSSIYGM